MIKATIHLAISRNDLFALFPYPARDIPFPNRCSRKRTACTKPVVHRKKMGNILYTQICRSYSSFIPVLEENTGRATSFHRSRRSSSFSPSSLCLILHSYCFFAKSPTRSLNPVYSGSGRKALVALPFFAILLLYCLSRYSFAESNESSPCLSPFLLLSAPLS